MSTPEKPGGRTSASNQLLDPQVLAQVAHLRIGVPRRVSGAIVGRHRSPLHGSSIEFAEHKEYTPGDEIRHLDWKAYARFDKYYVKRFEDETNVRALLVVDASGSMAYGSGSRSKLDYAKSLAASLAFILLRQQDSVGLIGFGSKVVSLVTPRSKSSHIEDLSRVLLDLEPSGETSLHRGLEAALEQAPRRSMIFVLSDFFDSSPEAYKLMAQLGRRHEVVFFHILDPAELEFPFDRMTLFRSMESPGEVLAEPQLVRDLYLRQFDAFREDLRRRATKNGIDYRLARTDESTGQLLVRFVTARAAADNGGPSFAV
jgi:uncharacterized protein (DUF58 family)